MREGDGRVAAELQIEHHENDSRRYRAQLTDRPPHAESAGRTGSESADAAALAMSRQRKYDSPYERVEIGDLVSCDLANSPHSPTQ